MATIITLSVVAILWVLSDTITMKLSNGKPFCPNELKGF